MTEGLQPVGARLRRAAPRRLHGRLGQRNGRIHPRPDRLVPKPETLPQHTGLGDLQRGGVLTLSSG